MEGRGITEIIIDFKVNWVINFSKKLLPKESLKKVDFKRFETTLYEYYDNVILCNKKYDDVFEEFEDKNKIIESLTKNGITDKKMQLLYVSLFKEDVIISWANVLPNSAQLMKELCMYLISTIYLALKLDQFVTLEQTTKVAYKKAIKEVLSKSNVGSDLLLNLEEKKIKLSKLFEDYETKNLKFVKRYNQTTKFKTKYIKINALDDSNTNMYLGKLNYTIRELSKENKKEVLKIATKSNVENNLMKIKLELITFNLFKDLLDKKDKIIFVDISKNFLKTKTNRSFIEKTLANVKNNIYLNISYDELLLYNSEINDLKENGINFSISKGEKDISFKKMYGIKYFFLKQEETISFFKTLSELKLGKIEPIITDFISESNEFKYYIK